ncbi:MAG: Trk system potassium transporter TrkA [Prevotellaceae bacterium]|jgi:trk system potassium uptake protein TrkA|nr:Trk system potassium transporter TrkA [Prevotellaceae bacterium]
MKIIIAGAGEVGTHLAKMLANENQDIIVIDENEDKLRPLESNYDLLAIKGNATSLKDLKEAGIKSADLFIAVTPEESKNVTACMLATKLGARKTVARIDNYEYMLPANKEFFKTLGVNHLIYPEMLAAKEIVSSLKRQWVRQWLEFYGGELILVGVKVRSGAPMVDKRFEELFYNNTQVRVVAIKRRNTTLIPKGGDEIKAEDIVYFITTQDSVDYVRELAGKDDSSIDNVMIMGGSRIAIKATQYLPAGMSVKIIEKDRERAALVVESLSDALVIGGDARDMELLKEEGIDDTDAFVAVTGNSEANILACLAAKRYGVKKTIAEVENIDYIPLAENLDIGTIINKKLISAGYIYQLTLNADVTDIKLLTNVDVDVIEFLVKDGSRITRAPVKELRLPRELHIGGIIRDGAGMIVTGDTHIRAEDRVIVFCYASYIRKIERYFD